MGILLLFIKIMKRLRFINYMIEIFHKLIIWGDYTCWDEANRECKGYDDEVIIKKVIESVQKKYCMVKLFWERDGYLFYKEKNIYPICATILKCAIQNRNQGVRILDIGGSLGSTYFQNKNYLTDVKNLEYIIAEQKTFYRLWEEIFRR